MKHDYIINLYLPNKQIFPCADQHNTLGIAMRWYISFIFSRVNSLYWVSFSQELSIHWVWEDNFLLDLLQGIRLITISSWKWPTAAGCELLNHKLFPQAHFYCDWLSSCAVSQNTKYLFQVRCKRTEYLPPCMYMIDKILEKLQNFIIQNETVFMVTMPPVYTKVWTMKYLIIIYKVVCPFSKRKL